MRTRNGSTVTCTDVDVRARSCIRMDASACHGMPPCTGLGARAIVNGRIVCTRTRLISEIQRYTDEPELS